MANSSTLVCDGCGQIASRNTLQALSGWNGDAVPAGPHHTLFLGAFSPHDEKDFLYAPGGEFQGEAALLLAALGISAARKSSRGSACGVSTGRLFFDAHPGVPARGRRRSAGGVEESAGRSGDTDSTFTQTEAGDAVTAELALVLDDILAMDLGCPVLLDNGKPFRLEGRAERMALRGLRGALAALRRTERMDRHGRADGSSVNSPRSG